MPATPRCEGGGGAMRLIGQVVLVFGLSFVAYRSGCVGFWAVFRCYKAERWGLDSL